MTNCPVDDGADAPADFVQAGTLADMTPQPTAPAGPHAQPDTAFLPRDGAGLREAHRLRAAGLVRPAPSGVVVAAYVGPGPAARARTAGVALRGLGGAGSADPVAVGFRTAAWIHTGGDEPAVVELAVPAGGRRVVGRGIRVRRVASLGAADVVRLGGVPVTTPARTAADVARDLPAAEAMDWLDRLRQHAGVSPDDVVDQLDAMPFARRISPARRLVRAWATR
jgi:hypothetical protein